MKKARIPRSEEVKEAIRKKREDKLKEKQKQKNKNKLLQEAIEEMESKREIWRAQADELIDQHQMFEVTTMTKSLWRKEVH